MIRGKTYYKTHHRNLIFYWFHLDPLHPHDIYSSGRVFMSLRRSLTAFSMIITCFHMRWLGVYVSVCVVNFLGGASLRMWLVQIHHPSSSVQNHSVHWVLFFLTFLFVTRSGGCVHQLTDCCYLHGGKHWIQTLIRVWLFLQNSSREGRTLFIFRNREFAVLIWVCANTSISYVVQMTFMQQMGPDCVFKIPL